MELNNRESDNSLSNDNGVSNNTWSPDKILRHAAKMAELKDIIHTKAKRNIDNQQKQDKEYYDKKHKDKRVSHHGLMILAICNLYINFTGICDRRYCFIEKLCP